MKTLKFFFLAAIFSFVFSHHTQAQVDDTLPPWFRDPGRILTPKIIDWNSTYLLQNKRQVISRSSKATVSGKSVQLPNNIKELNGPITLKRGNNCYEVYCARNKSCGDCTFLWKDLNRDGKIQPKRELRCVCKRSGDNCGIKARKVDCN
ncbi:MAG: hypothetical protein AAF705_06620 [Bacteroidota bacterium]